MNNDKSFTRLISAKSTWNHATIHVFGAEPLIVVPGTKIQIVDDTIEIFIDNVPNMYPQSEAEAKGEVPPIIGETTLVMEKEDIVYITFWKAKAVQPTFKPPLVDAGGNALKSV